MKKTILITGASCEIGQCLIKELSDVYNLVLIYNQNYEPLKKYVDKYLVINTNLESEDEILKLTDTLKKKNVNIYALINIAGISLDSPLTDINMYDFTKTFIINTYAPLKLTLMLKPEIVINLSSTDAIDTFNEYNLVYALSKNSLLEMTNLLSKLTISKVYALAPNYIDTLSVRNMNPEFLKNELNRINQKELIKPENVAKSIFEILKTKDQSGTIYRMDDNNGYRKINK